MNPRLKILMSVIIGEALMHQILGSQMGVHRMPQGLRDGILEGKKMDGPVKTYPREIPYTCRLMAYSFELGYMGLFLISI